MCRVTFSPNIVQQAKISTSGLLGDFVIRYDVQRDMGIGDIQVRRSHFFSKSNKEKKNTRKIIFHTQLLLTHPSGFLPKCCFYL